MGRASGGESGDGGDGGGGAGGRGASDFFLEGMDAPAAPLEARVEGAAALKENAHSPRSKTASQLAFIRPALRLSADIALAGPDRAALR